MRIHPPEHADDDWVTAARAFVALAQRAAIVPEPTPPTPPAPPLPPTDVPPEIGDPDPWVPPAPVRDPPKPPPTQSA